MYFLVHVKLGIKASLFNSTLTDKNVVNRDVTLLFVAVHMNWRKYNKKHICIFIYSYIVFEQGYQLIHVSIVFELKKRDLNIWSAYENFYKKLKVYKSKLTYTQTLPQTLRPTLTLTSALQVDHYFSSTGIRYSRLENNL